MSVRRIYVEKRQDYAVKAKELKEELKTYLGINGVDNIRILIWIIYRMKYIKKL